MRLWTPGLPILTTNHVGETWTFLSRRDGHPPAVAFLAAVEPTLWLSVVHVEEETEREARAWLTPHVRPALDLDDLRAMRAHRFAERPEPYGDEQGPAAT